MLTYCDPLSEWHTRLPSRCGCRAYRASAIGLLLQGGQCAFEALHLLGLQRRQQITVDLRHERKDGNHGNGLVAGSWMSEGRLAEVLVRTLSLPGTFEADHAPVRGVAQALATLRRRPSSLWLFSTARAHNRGSVSRWRKGRTMPSARRASRQPLAFPPPAALAGESLSNPRVDLAPGALIKEPT